ncbi:hypothetical protein CsSME_00052007 [Camellia sinensis var. sinensis]
MARKKRQAMVRALARIGRMRLKWGCGSCRRRSVGFDGCGAKKSGNGGGGGNNQARFVGAAFASNDDANATANPEACLCNCAASSHSHRT